jgi:peptidoglycan hydrolase-like protein with peptidoglycan-binding domain
MNRAEHLAIVLSGHFVSGNGDSYLLHTDAGVPNAFTLGGSGFSVNAMLELAGRHAGQSVVAIADQGAPLTLGGAMRAGFRVGDIPQGAMVLAGAQRAMARFITTKLLVPGQVVSQALNEPNAGVSGFGYLPQALPFLTGVSTPPVVDNGDFDERRLWQQVSAQNTVTAYQLYLNRYPNGQFAQSAVAQIDALQLTPQDQARLAEEALNLDRNQRRAIQRNLTLIGFDTAGVDGILGRRSRQAIASWQQSLGLMPTSFLSANQIAQIETAGAARAEQLRIEAERRRAEQERQDRNYWGQTGANGSEAGLRTYLQRYPDGLFSGDATERLKQIEREQRRLAQAEERRAWDQAVMTGTLESYVAYLNAYPNGRFVDEAKARAQSLQNPETPQDVVNAAEQEENQLNLDGFARRLIEAQLQRLNYDPGPADGKFTQETRRALRKYQRANSMTVTGYVTKQTIVQLLAAGLGR